MNRSRIHYAVASLVAIALGLGSRKYREILPGFLADYAGDTLWALVVFLGWGVLFPRSATASNAAGAGLFAAAIEFSQLYHAPWIDAIRHTTLGGLVLGFDFLWSDLLCYAAGIALGAAGEQWWGTKPQGDRTAGG